MLMAALMSASDHLGYIMRGKPDNRRTHTVANLSKLFEELGSPYKDVHLILAICGRHAIVHSAWPETLVKVTESEWFGFNPFVEASARQMVVYQPSIRYGNKELDVIKLGFNVCAYFNDLDVFFFRRIEPARYEDAFQRIREHLRDRPDAFLGGIWRGGMEEELREQISRVRRFAPAERGVGWRQSTVIFKGEK